MKKLQLIFILWILSTPALCQSNSVRVTLNIAGPYSTNIMDYAPSENNKMGKMIVTVQNMTRTELKIYLRGDIKGTGNDVRIFMDTDYVPATGITLAPLETRQLFSHEIMDLYDPNHLTYVGTNQAELRRSRHVPEGEYSICVRAYDHTPGRTSIPLSAEQPSGCLTVFMRNTEPPILIQPAVEAEVRAMDIQNVIFSWTVPAGTPAGSAYRLKIVEMFDPNRNPNDAFLSATTPAIFEKDLVSPVYVYGPADVPLVQGRKYAWAVMVVDPRGFTSYQNQGRSEVRAFTYGKTAAPIALQVTGITAPAPKPKEKPGAVLVTTGRVRFTPDLEVRNLIRNRFKGKLVWAYRRSETGHVTEPVALTTTAVPGPTAANPAFSTMELTAVQSMIRSGKVETLSNPAALGVAGNLPARDYYVTGSGKSSLGFIDNGIPQLTDIHKIVSKREQHQAKINALAADTRYPLGNIKVSLYLRKVKRNDKTTLAFLQFLIPPQTPDELLIGQTTTNEQGEFSLDYHDNIPLGYEALLRIGTGYFEFADYDIPLQQQNGVYDLGELLGLAKTYRLKIKVVSKEGTRLDAVTLKLERPKGYYDHPNRQNLKHEVMRDSLPKQPEEVVALGGAEAYWPRAFFSNGYLDSYRVVIEGEGILRSERKVRNVNLFSTSEGGTLYADKDRVPTLIKELVADVPPPVVEGRVLTKQGEVPVAGAQVLVRKKGTTGDPRVIMVNGWPIYMIDVFARTVISDSTGKFKVENIIATPEPYEVVVRYKGKETRHDKDLYLSRNGIKEVIDPLFINAEQITVTGKVVDTGGEPLADATLTWKSGGKAFYSDEEGNFIGTQVEGKHVLVARKPGFKDTEYTVELKMPSKNAGRSATPAASTAAMSNWATSVGASFKNFTGTGVYNNQKVTPKPTPGKSFAATIGFSNLAAGATTHTNLNFNYYAVFGDGFTSSAVSGNHVIVMSNFYVKVKVKDHGTQQPIANAIVKAEGSSGSFSTGADGVAIVGNVPGGNAALIVNGPPDSFYASVKAELAIDASKDTIAVEVSLKPGAQAKGQVRSKGAALAGAEVAVEGLEHIQTVTDAGGNYVLSGVPAGEYTLIASKEGLLSDRKAQNFMANQVATVDFNLTDPGFNAASLLGFKLVLHKSAPGANANEFIISGELRDIPDNPVFKMAENPGFRIKFTDKVVVKEGNTIYPKGNELVTDVSEIRLKAFDFVAVTLKNASGIRLRAVEGSNRTRGELTGEGVIDIGGTFSSLSGIRLPDVPLTLKPESGNVIAPINSSGNLALSSLGIAGKTEGWQLYGITLIPDLANSGIDKEGINLKGKIRIDGVPLLSNQELNLTGLTINRRGEIKNAAVNLNPAPTLTLVNWKLKLTGVQINPYGLRLSGDMDVPIPSSETAKIGVRELGISNGSLSGGTFQLPSAGIDIFGLVKFKTTPGRDFSFQKLAGANHYRFVGAGTIDLPKWIKQRVELDNFSIATNGDFSVIAKTDVEVNFADMARLGITKFGFDSRTTAITVGGKFRLNIPMFGAGAQGTLHFRKGYAPRMDELGIYFSLMSAIELEARLAFNENEFRGKGGLKIAGLTGVGLEFWYIKQGTKPRVGAQFMANMVIPIGLVKLDKLQGGFDFDFAKNIYSINAGGRITVAPDPGGMVALDPVKVTVTSTPGGPIFEGKAFVKVLTSWEIGTATLKLDFNKKQFFIDGKFGAGFNLMKGVSVESYSGVHLELYTGAGSNYWFVAGYSRTSIFSILNSNVTVAAGWNIPQNKHESLRDIPGYVLTNGRLYGGYFGTSSSIRLGPYTASFLDLASASLWYHNFANCEVFANFRSNSFGFKVASGWSAGGSVDVWGIGTIASADVGLSGMLEGHYNSNSWGAGGHFSGHVRGHIGCNGGCNGITWGGCFNACILGCRVCPIPCGLKVCASASANASYSSQSGLKLSLSLGE